MRALGDPDAFPAGDIGIKHGLERLGQPAEGPPATAIAEPWRPWRSYAVMHLWALVSAAPDGGLVTDQLDQVLERDVRVHEV
jgi:3-methyladenine DNA glycosylase/8-oxoguanine DNA glycosylase